MKVRRFLKRLRMAVAPAPAEGFRSAWQAHQAGRCSLECWYCDYADEKRHRRLVAFFTPPGFLNRHARRQLGVIAPKRPWRQRLLAAVLEGKAR